MQKIIPAKLVKGDEVRIVAPSRGIKIIGRDCRDLARERFESWGLKVSFAANATEENWDMFGTTEIAKRADDINNAFKDPRVKAIFTIIGGFNSNQLLPYLDYELIKANPKIFCGFSDITALLDGIYAQTGLVTFSGPHFSSLGMKKGAEYTIENMQKMLMGSGVNEVQPSAEWSDDPWFMDQENRVFIKNDGYWKLQSGEVEGKLLGGNLGTFNLLLGSKYRPEFTPNTIFFAEDTSGADIYDFMRNLTALTYQPDFKNVKGLVIGRFQKDSQVSRAQLEHMISLMPELKSLPILANVDFGHTTPLLTLPIGGIAKITSDGLLIQI